jgi:2-desacetyl-2-hydroxyethyl bacteriochlorophyllide A dehydrogenase
MRAVWLEDRNLSFRKDIPQPEPGEKEALVRVRLAGICGTDLKLVNGYYPFCGIPGHEFVGEIVQAPPAPQRIGQRVVGDINIACAKCFECRAGRHSHCRQRRVLGIKNRHGAFADYLCLPLRNLHPVPPAVPDDTAVFAEPLAAALRIQQQIHIGRADRVLVIGAGRLGQLIARTLAGTGGRLTVVARYPNQQALLDTKGIAWLQETDVGDRAYDIVIEATGSFAGFTVARRAVRPGGTIVLKSTYREDKMQIAFSSLVVDEISLVGSRCGPMALALDQLEKKGLDPSGLIAGRFPLDEALTAFKHASTPGALKIILHTAS